MEPHEHTIKIESREDVITIFAIGDLHVASVAFEKERCKQAIKQIAETPYSVWVGMGDFGECIGPTNDPRFDQNSIREPYRSNLHRYHQLETEELKELFAPIADKNIGLLIGNHEDKLRQKLNFDLTWDLCNCFGWKNLSMEGMIRLKVERQEGSTTPLTIFAAHGYGGGRTWGGKLNKLSQAQTYFDADIYFMAHNHSQGAVKEVRLAIPHGGKLRFKEHIRLLVNVPAFYKTYQEGIDTYASKFLYPPSALGMAEVRVKIIQENVPLSDGTKAKEDAWDIRTIV